MLNEGDKIKEAEKSNPTCVSDYTKCKDNKELIEKHVNKNDIKPSIDCLFAAKKLAKYGEPHFPFMSFCRFIGGNSYVVSGKAVLMEDDATFKNGFGADVHVTARCEYDLKNNVANVTVIPKE